MATVSINIAAAVLWAVLGAAVPLTFPFGQRLTAEDIARRVQDRDTGRDSRVTLRMKLYDRHGRARERQLAEKELSARLRRLLRG